MKRTTALFAAALAASFALPAASQGFDDMQEGLTMLESSVNRAFEQFSIEADPMALSLLQLGAIYGLLSSDMSEGQIGGRIQAIVNR